jgi:Holliday junction resolvase RusA-like endonuclease
MNEIIAAAKSGRGKGNAYARQKATWTTAVAAAARSARVRPVASPVIVSCVWHEPSARRDPDNVMAGVKFVMDGMVSAGVIDGDGCADVVSVRHEVIAPSPTPGVVVTVTSLPDRAIGER